MSGSVGLFSTMPDVICFVYYIVCSKGKMISENKWSVNNLVKKRYLNRLVGHG